MKFERSPIQSRILALVILFALAAGLGALLSWPVRMAFATHDDDIQDAFRTLAQFRAIAVQRDSLESQRADLVSQAANLQGLADGASPELSTAKLQTEIRALIEQQGGKIRSSQPLAVTSANGFDKLDLRYDFSIAANRFSGLVYQLDTHTPYLFIDTVDLNVPERPTAALSDAPTPGMEVRWTITAYRRSKP